MKTQHQKELQDQQIVESIASTTAKWLGIKSRKLELEDLLDQLSKPSISQEAKQRLADFAEALAWDSRVVPQAASTKACIDSSILRSGVRRALSSVLTGSKGVDDRLYTGKWRRAAQLVIDAVSRALCRRAAHLAQISEEQRMNMKTRHSRKHICEALRYWRAQLRKLNENGFEGHDPVDLDIAGKNVIFGLGNVGVATAFLEVMKEAFWNGTTLQQMNNTIENAVNAAAGYKQALNALRSLASRAFSEAKKQKPAKKLGFSDRRSRLSPQHQAELERRKRDRLFDGAAEL